MFVSEAIEGRAGGVVGGRLNDQDGAPPAVIIQLPATAEDAFAVLPQDLRIAVGVLVIQGVRHHLSESVYATRSNLSRPVEIVPHRLRNATRPLILTDPPYADPRFRPEQFGSIYWKSPGAPECCKTACTSP